MVNVNKLKGKIVENGLTIGTLAKKLGIDRSTYTENSAMKAKCLPLKRLT